MMRGAQGEWGLVRVSTATFALLCACGSPTGADPESTGGAPGAIGGTSSGTGGLEGGGTTTGGTSGGTGGLGGGGTTTGGTSSGTGGASGENICAPEAGTRAPGADLTWNLRVELIAGNAPFTLGQEFLVEDRKYNLTTLKFFLAEPRLTTEAGETVRAQFVSSIGDPTPYNVVLVDAEQTASLDLSIAVPAGSYTGLELGLGLPAPCNASDPSLAVYPLSLDADMFWTWGAQYVFQRVQGKALIDDVWQPLAYHLGFDPYYRQAHLSHTLHTDSLVPSTKLIFDATAFFAAPPGEDIPLENHSPAPEWLLENLTTQAFTLAPGDAQP